MKLSKTFFILISIFGFFADSYCQDLHIYYDKQTDAVRYESNGKTLKNPKVKKGANVYLHVQNYNNFLYKANVEVDNIIINPPASSSGNPLMGLLPMGGSGQPSFNLLDMGVSKLKSGIVSLLEDNKPTSDEDISGFGTVDDDEDIMAFAQLQEDFSSTIGKIETIEKEFKEISEEVKKEIESKKIRETALQEIDQIKFNPDLTPNQIKRLSKEYFGKVFKQKPIEEINLDEVLAMGDMPAQMEKNLNKLKIKSNEYSQAESALRKLEDQTGEFLGFASFEFNEIREELDETFGFIATVKEAVKEDMKTMEVLSKDNSGIDIKQITALRNEYEIMEENDFSQTFRAQATGDVVSFDISFDSKDPGGSATRVAVISDIEVPVAGGLKIHPSLGVSFGQFFEKPEEYFIKDDKIVATEGGKFVPIVTSFIHFYLQSAKGASFGGSLGMGFPVAATGGYEQSLYFFIGPSVILGRESKIVITGGIMGGKSSRLSAGYEVGDVFLESSSILPTSSNYETGFFLGISYNIGN